MGYTIFGKAIDENKQPVAFAIVFTSDSKGNPLTPSKNTTTDENGQWKLDNLTDNDYITIRIVGINPKTFSAKSVPLIPIGTTGFSQRMIQTTMGASSGASLAEVEVNVPKYTPIPKKKNYGKYILIGGLLLLVVAGALHYIEKNKKIIKA